PDAYPAVAGSSACEALSSLAILLEPGVDRTMSGRIQAFLSFYSPSLEVAPSGQGGNVTRICASDSRGLCRECLRISVGSTGKLLCYTLGIPIAIAALVSLGFP